MLVITFVGRQSGYYRSSVVNIHSLFRFDLMVTSTAKHIVVICKKKLQSSPRWNLKEHQMDSSSPIILPTSTRWFSLYYMKFEALLRSFHLPFSRLYHSVRGRSSCGVISTIHVWRVRSVGRVAICDHTTSAQISYLWPSIAPSRDSRRYLLYESGTTIIRNFQTWEHFTALHLFVSEGCARSVCFSTLRDMAGNNAR